MSPEAQQIAIAKACGYHGAPFCAWTERGAHLRMMKGALDFPVPDYLNDRNAMAEARKSLTKEERWLYVSALVDLTGAEWTDAYEEVFTVLDATPAQHAEAFLKAKHL